MVPIFWLVWLDGRMELHQLVEALFCGLTASGIPWKSPPQGEYGGDKTPERTLGGDSAQTVQLGWRALLQLQNLFLSLCNVPGSFPCSFHGIWVGHCTSRGARCWDGSKMMNDFCLCSPA